MNMALLNGLKLNQKMMLNGKNRVGLHIDGQEQRIIERCAASPFLLASPLIVALFFSLIVHLPISKSFSILLQSNLTPSPKQNPDKSQSQQEQISWVQISSHKSEFRTNSGAKFVMHPRLIEKFAAVVENASTLARIFLLRKNSLRAKKFA